VDQGKMADNGCQEWQLSAATVARGGRQSILVFINESPEDDHQSGASTDLEREAEVEKASAVSAEGLLFHFSDHATVLAGTPVNNAAAKGGDTHALHALASQRVRR
jgi:hypothetical protein